RPRFVTLGTIEPRKNHALLLDVWDSLPPPRPQLVVIGRRGWADQALFARIAATPDVAEFNTLDDGQVAAVLTGAQALLMPSFAEGFGLPLTE
ncbi:glycosyltransferase, partial [Streptomyces sp. P17]|uniref:glycosyltransferase n=1 Tax=Streptomyces sp. P17 TaxID=3074716 RepID=UPI0028F3EEFD